MTTIVVAGSLAQRPGRAGHAWVFLNYLLGFRDLGYEVLFVDRLSAEMLGDADRSGPVTASRQARWLTETMKEAGLEGCYSALLDEGGAIGLPRDEVRERLAASVLLLNVNGFLTDEELLAAAPRRVYLDIDPGFGQMWEKMGLAQLFDGHENFVTVGVNVGKADCPVPIMGRRWITTHQPIVLERWPPAQGGESFTTVATWRGPFDSVSYDGTTYGLRAHEFRRFAALPTLLDAPFEIALDIDPADHRDVELLEGNAWRLVEPHVSAGSPSAYRQYVQGSMAEVAIAKGMYVKTKGGWFSDRSACYLASGKPVLAQDTGFGNALPTGEGLLRFSDLGEAVEGAEEICANHLRHSVAARAIAEEFFDSRKVLTRLLEELDAR